MPLDTSWADSLPAAAPTAAMRFNGIAPAWKPAAGAPTNYVPTIDVTRHPSQSLGQPGSEFAPTAQQPTPNAPKTDVMPVPTHDASWADAIPAAHPTPAMRIAAGETPGPQGGGFMANLGAGTSENVAQTLGAPVDAVTAGINAGLRGLYGAARAVNGAIGAPAPPAQAPQITNPVGGSDWWKSAEGLIGADPRTVVANNETDRIARGAGQGVAGMLLPWAAARALPAIADLGGAAERLLSPATSTASAPVKGVTGAIAENLGAGGAPTMGVVGGAAGGAGQLAADSVPEPYKPVADFAVQMAVGAPILAAKEGLSAAGRAIRPVLESSLPLTQRLRAQQAAAPFARALSPDEQDVVHQAASAMPEVRSAEAVLSDPNATAAQKAAAQADLAMLAPQSGVLVPGSHPTSFQLTANPTLGTMERGAGAQSQYAPAFNDLRAQQNAARVANLTAQGGADIDAVVPWFADRLRDLRLAEDAEIAGRHGTAGAALDAAGRPVAAHEAGATVRGAVEAQRAPELAQSDAALTGAQQNAEAETGALGGPATPNAVQEHGIRMLGTWPAEGEPGTGLLGAKADTKAAAQRLYDTIDPEGKLALDVSPVGRSARELLDEVDPEAGDELLAPERRILDAAAKYRGVELFSKLRKLRSNITTALREIEDKDGPAYRRLTRLLGAVEGTMADAAGEAAKDPAVAEQLSLLAREGVHQPPTQSGLGEAASAIAPTPSELPSEADMMATLQAEAEAHVAAKRAAQRAAKAQAGGNLGASAGGDAGSGPSGVRGAHGAEIPSPGRSGNSARNQSVSRESSGLVSNFTAAARDKLRRANAAWADYKARFGKGAVGDVLARTSRTPSGFRVPASMVPSRLFAPGTRGAEAADSLIAAVGHDGALQVLGDYPAYSLRQAAEEMGTLNLKKYEKWVADHQSILDKFPELKAAFDSAAKARAVLDDLKAQRRAIDLANPIRPGWGDAEIMQRFVAPGPRGREAAEALVQATGETPAALDATRDYLASILRDRAVVKSGPHAGELDRKAYRTFVKDYGPFLSHPAMAPARAAFENAEAAQAALERAATEHQAAQEQYLRSAARHFLPDESRGAHAADVDPAISMGRILSQRDPGPELADLARQTAHDPVAREGLQSTVIHWLLDQAQSNNAAGTNLDDVFLKNDRTQTLIGRLVGDDLDGPLRHIMTPEQMRALNNTRLDLRRSNLSISGNRTPGGGSDTALLTSAREADEHRPHIAGTLAAMETLGDAAQEAVGRWGRVLGILAVPIMQAARRAGFRSVADLRAEALLHPERLSALLAHAPATDDQAKSALMAIRQQLTALGAEAAVHSEKKVKRGM